jgi:hypothetical protein
VIFASCAVNHQYPKLTEQSIPTFSHTKPIDLYYPEEKKPEGNYVRLGVLEVSLANYVAYNELVKILCKEAQIVGADALFLYQKHYLSNSYLDSDGTNSTSSNSSLNALAIKYIDSINYLDRLLKEAVVIHQNNDSLKISYDYFGKATSTLGNDAHYRKYIKPYRLQHLLYDTENWVYMEQNYSTMRKFMGFNGFPVKNVQYPDGEKPKWIKVRSDIMDEPSKYTIQMAYNNEGQVEEKIILRGKRRSTIRQVFEYNAGRLMLQRVYDDGISNTEPLLTVHYSYYSQEFLPNLLSNENAHIKR